jgi:hypothetical protein
MAAKLETPNAKSPGGTSTGAATKSFEEPTPHDTTASARDVAELDRLFQKVAGHPLRELCETVSSWWEITSLDARPFVEWFLEDRLTAKLRRLDPLSVDCAQDALKEIREAEYLSNVAWGDILMPLADALKGAQLPVAE